MPSQTHPNSAPPNAALYFEPDGYTTTSPRLMGRQAAGSAFLAGFVRHSGVARFICQAPDAAAAQAFAEAVAAAGGPAEVKWIPPDAPAALAGPGCLYLPGPDLGRFAYRRLRAGERLYSLCGVTHTTASAKAMDAIAGLPVAPVRSWDALICTSRAVRDTVRHLLEAQAEYLRWRLGATRLETPQLPLIPLGVECDAFAFGAAERAAARAALGIGEGEAAVLFLGRLSFHAKAHPLPMYLALERAAAGRRVHLIQAGWFANAAIEQAFRNGAAALCPSVRAVFLDGRDPAQRRTAWAAADLFTSLSDNIQETFGLAPIEAMAAGLPVVVTDWDGYRDTVRDGVDGVRVPTLMPPAPLGADLAARHEVRTDTYDLYCGHTSQLVAVDVAACEQAYARLLADPELRRRMGEAGRARARALYDWRVIVGRYQELWAELAERRRADASLWPDPAPAADPARPDPFAAFASYPTARLGDDHVVALAPGAGPAVLAERRRLEMVEFARYVFPAEAECEAVLARLAEAGPCRVADLLRAVPAGRRAAVARGLVWMAKLDAVRIAPPAPPRPGGGEA